MFKDCKPLKKSPCCNAEMRFRYACDDVSGDMLVSCVCKRCGKNGAWYNVPICDKFYWRDSAHDFASLYWKRSEFDNAESRAFM